MAAAGSSASLSLALLMATTAMVVPGYVRANPTGGSVAAGNGSATISGEGTGSVIIDQTSERVIIDWDSFDIAVGEHTRFDQVSGGIVLNRIGDADASTINGFLDASGTIFLVNPNGVMFGGNAVVNVGSLVATTADITDDTAFLDPTKHSFSFDQAGAAGATISVQAGASITVADNGLAALVAPTVVNSGTIVAELGTVELAGAETLTVDLTGDGLLTFDTGIATSVTQAGGITADGGYVRLSAMDAVGLVGGVIDMSGTIRAQTASSQNGTVVLSGGTVTVSDAVDTGAAGAIFVKAGTGGVTAGGDLTAGTLGIVSDGDATLNGAGNAIGTLAADIDGDLTLSNSAALTVGSVDDQAGGTLDGVAADNVALTAAGNITVADAAPVTAQTGDITLTTNAATGSLSLGENLSAADGNIFLTAGTGGIALANGATLSAQGLGVVSGDDATLNGAVGTLAANVEGDLTLSNGAALVVGSVAGHPSGALTGIVADTVTLDAVGDLTVATGASITADVGNIDLGTTDAGGMTFNGNLTALSGDVFLDAAGDILRTGTAVISTGTLDISNAQAVTLTGDVDTLAVNASGNLNFASVDDLSLDGVTAANVDVSSGGSLTVASAIAGDNVTLTTGNTGALAINADIDSGAGDVTLDAGTGGIFLDDTVAAITAQNLDITSDDAASMGDGHAVAGLSGTIGGDLTFGATSDLSVDGITAANVHVSTTGKLTIASAVTADGGDGDITLAAGAGGITSGNGLLTAQDLAVTSGAAAALGIGHDIDGLSADVTGALTFGSANALDLDGITADDLTITSGGDLTVASDVTADNVILTAGDENKLAVNANIDAGPDDVTLDAGTGGVTVATGVTITAQDLDVTSDGMATLGDGHDIDGLSADVTGALTFGGTGNLRLEGIEASSITVGTDGDLSLNGDANAGGGNIALQAGGAISYGSGFLTAANLSIDAGGDAALGDGHAISALSGTVGGNLTFGSENALDLDGVSADGMELSADSFSLNAGVTATSGDIVLRAVDGSVVTNGNLFSAVGLGIESTGTIDLSGTHDVDVLAVDAGSGDVAFQSAGALEIGEIDGIAGVSGDAVTLVTGGALTLANDVNAGADDVSLTAIVGGIDSSGGAINGGDLTIVAAGDVNLNDNANDVDSVTATLTGYDLAFLDADMISLGAIDAANIEATATVGDLTVGNELSAGNIGLAAGDGIILDQSLTATGTIFMAAGAGGIALANGMTLTAAELGIRSGGVLDLSGDHNVGTLAVDAAGQDLDFSATGALEIGSVTGIGGSTIEGVSVADLTLNVDGALTSSEAVTATSLNIQSAQSVTLENDNDVDVLKANITGPLSFTDADGVTLDGVSALGQTVTLNAGGDIGTVTGSLVTAATLDIDAAEDVTLDGDVDTLTADASGTVNFDDSDDISVDVTAGAVDVFAGGLLTVVSATSASVGDLRLTSGDTSGLNIGADLSATAGDIILDAGADGITLANDAALTAAGLGIRSDGELELSGTHSVDTLAVDAAGQDLAFVNEGALSVGDIDDPDGDISGINAANANLTVLTGDLTLDSALDVGTGAATLTATGGNITSPTGTVTAGHLNATAAAGNIDLDGDVTILSATAGGSLAFADANALTVAGASGGSVDVSAGGLLTTVGAVAATSGNLSLTGGGLVIGANLEADGNDILLTAGTGGIGATAGAAMMADGLGIVSGGAVNLAGPHAISTIAASAAGQALNFASSGPLSIGTVGGIAGVTAGAATLAAGSGNLTVDSGIQASAVSLRSGGTGGIIVNAAANSGGGTMVLDAGTGGIVTNGMGLTAGRLALISNGTIDLTDPNRVGVLAVRAPGRAFGFVNDGTLRVGTVAGVSGISAGPVDLTVTSGDLIFDANHFMGGRNILRAPNGRAIFNGRIDGGHDLYVLALRDVFFNAAVGEQSPLRGVIVGSSYDFPAGLDLAVLTSDTILAAADAVGDTDGNIAVNDLFRTTGAVVMTADLIHGSVTTLPDPNRAFDVGALFVSGRWATVYGKVAQFHDFGAAYEARRRELLDLPFRNPNYPIPEDFQMNECTIGTICPDPLAVTRLTPTQPIESFIGQPLLVSPVARMIGNDQELFSNSGNEEIW